MPRRRQDPDRPIASDKLIARKSGIWGKDKLSFLDQFLPAALHVAARIPRRVYLDLFAGPGRNVDTDLTGEEFDGAALRVVRHHATDNRERRFTDAILINKNGDDHAALTQRIDAQCASGECLVPRERIQLIRGDTNLIIGEVLRAIDRSAYVLAFADPDNPSQLPWTTIQSLRTYGPSRIDLYVLFPLDMALGRMMSYNTDATEVNANALTEFFGGEEWRPIAEHGRMSESRSPQMRNAILKLYMSKLRDLDWPYVRLAREITRRGEQRLYKMLFATANKAAANIGLWAAEQTRRDRGTLDLFEDL